VLRRRGWGQSEEFLNLADAQFTALGEGAENAEPVEVGECLGDGEDVAQGGVPPIFRHSAQ
jgi:hypothetical protein